MVIDSKKTVTAFRPGTPEERQLILGQLDRILQSHFLNQSQRYSRLLRYLVQQALTGDVPKERIVGAEVFGREPGYDTTLDPVVRTTTAQLRRRIAQYYQSPGREQEIVIELPPRGYAVEFHVPEAVEVPAVETPAVGIVVHGEPLNDLVPQTPVVPLSTSRPFRSRLILATSLLILAVGFFGLYKGTAGRSALSKFWEPLLDSPAPILICIGRPSTSLRTPAGETPAADEPTVIQNWMAKTPDWPPTVNTAIAAMLKSNGHEYYLGKAEAITLSDLRRSPAVMTGALNNQWTMKLGESLRFHYGSDHKGNAWIEDAQNPAQRSWQVDFRSPSSALHEDYGIIARFTDPQTKNPVVFATAIVGYGTKAAGDFLTTDKYLEAMTNIAPRGWERKNMEIVFSVPILDGKAGAARILATHFW